MDILHVRSLWGARFLGFWALFALAVSLRAEGPWHRLPASNACSTLRALEKSRAALIEARRAVDQALAEVDTALALVRSECQTGEDELAGGAVIEEAIASTGEPISEKAARLLRDLWQRTEETANRVLEAWKSKAAAIWELRARTPERPEEGIAESRQDEEKVVEASAAPAVFSDSEEGVQRAAETQASEPEFEAPWWEPLWSSEPSSAGRAEAAADRQPEEPWWEPVPPTDEPRKERRCEDPIAPPRRPEESQGWMEP